MSAESHPHTTHHKASAAAPHELPIDPRRPTQRNLGLNRPGRSYGLRGGQLRKSVILTARTIRAEWRIYAVSITVSALFGMLTVALSRVIGWLTDSKLIPILEGDQSVSTIWAGALVLLAVIVALVLSIAGRRISASYGVFHMQANHRRELSRKFTTLEPRWHGKSPAGKLLAHVSSDAEAATTVFNPLPYMLGSVVMLLVSTVMLLLIDPWLALAAMAIVPLMIAANLLFQKYMTPAVTRAQELRGEVSEVAHESFDAATLVKALGTRDREEQRFGEKSQELRFANVRVGIVRAMFDPVVEALPNVGSLLVIVVGVWRLSQGAVGPGDIVTAAYLLSLFAVPVRTFGWVLADMPRSVVGWERVAGVVDTEPAIAYGHAALPRSGGAGLPVTFEHVEYHINDESTPVSLLRDVSFTAAVGQTTVLMGRTGAGKTIAVSMIARLWDPTSGVVRIGGSDVRELTRASLSELVAFVSQGAFIFEDTVRANVTLGHDYSDEQVWAALELAQLAKFVRTLPSGLDTHLGEGGSNLSGGQRQRLAIARAVVRQPAVLVLDDATSAVDPQVEQAILAGISQVGQTTVIMVAYRSASAQRADHIVFLDQGRIVGGGTHEELLASLEQYGELVHAYDEARGENQDSEDEDRDDERGENSDRAAEGSAAVDSDYVDAADEGGQR